MRLDWVPCEKFGDDFTTTDIVTGLPVDIILATPVQISEAPQVTAPDEADDITVLRTVGQFNIIIKNVAGDKIDAQGAFFAARMRTAVQDSLGSPLTYTDDLTDPNDANEPFMWTRFGNLEGFDMLDVNKHPWWSSIDVKVKRRLSLQQSTVLSVSIFAGTVIGAFSAVVIPYIRSLVKVRR